MASIELQSVDQWLESIQLHHYAPDFAKAGYNVLSQCSDLTEEILKSAIGVNLAGHLKRILAHLPPRSTSIVSSPSSDFGELYENVEPHATQNINNNAPTVANVEMNSMPHLSTKHQPHHLNSQQMSKQNGDKPIPKPRLTVSRKLSSGNKQTIVQPSVKSPTEIKDSHQSVQANSEPYPEDTYGIKLLSPSVTHGSDSNNISFIDGVVVTESDTDTNCGVNDPDDKGKLEISQDMYIPMLPSASVRKKSPQPQHSSISKINIQHSKKDDASIKDLSTSQSNNVKFDASVKSPPRPCIAPKPNINTNSKQSLMRKKGHTYVNVTQPSTLSHSRLSEMISANMDSFDLHHETEVTGVSDHLYEQDVYTDMTSPQTPKLVKVDLVERPSAPSSQSTSADSEPCIYEAVWNMESKKCSNVEQSTPSLDNTYTNVDEIVESESVYDQPPPAYAPPPLPRNTKIAVSKPPPIPPRIFENSPSNLTSDVDFTTDSNALFPITTPIDPFSGTDPFTEFVSECEDYNTSYINNNISNKPFHSPRQDDQNKDPVTNDGFEPSFDPFGLRGNNLTHDQVTGTTDMYCSINDFDPFMTNRTSSTQDGAYCMTENLDNLINDRKEIDQNDYIEETLQNPNSFTDASFERSNVAFDEYESADIYMNESGIAATACPGKETPYLITNVSTRSDVSKPDINHVPPTLPTRLEHRLNLNHVPPTLPTRHEDNRRLSQNEYSRATFGVSEEKSAVDIRTHSPHSIKCNDQHPSAIPTGRLSVIGRQTSMGSSVKIIDSTLLNRVKERSGYLYKQGGLQGNKGWRKRWVIFNGEDLRYFDDIKTCISNKIIPVSSMESVDNDAKADGSKRFKFKLKSKKRVYLFAAETLEDCTLWCQLLMEAILTYHKTKGGCPEDTGGKMHNADKEGFIKFNVYKNKYYVAVKKDLLCYYKNKEDFDIASPIHEIPMKLASVKQLVKNKLQLSTNYNHFILSFESTDDLIQWKLTFEDAIAEGLGDDTVIKQVMECHSNQLCADCRSNRKLARYRKPVPDPHWASVNFGITLCKVCAGIHREFVMSRIKSLRMDTKIWTPGLIDLMRNIGNDRANAFWEFNMLGEDEISPTANIAERKLLLEKKYKQKLYCQLHTLSTNKAALNEELLKSAQTPDVLTTMQILFSNAEIMYHPVGQPDDTAHELAKRAGQRLQVEFLYQNGGDGSVRMTDAGVHETRIRTTVCLQGYINKTGGNMKDFTRRWCVLEHGCLSYFLDDKSPTAKGMVECASFFSVYSVSLNRGDKYVHTFEVSTSKQGNRIYLFATDFREEKTTWMQTVAKSFCPIPLMEEVCKSEFLLAGFFHLREGLTQEWSQIWLMVHGKLMTLTSTDGQVHEIDSRKIINMKLQEADACPLVSEVGPCFLIDLPGKSLYIEGEIIRETEKLYSILHQISLTRSGKLEEQQLTAGNIPITVDKCIAFIELHGQKSKGIYRTNGTHSKITKLLEDFKTDARSIVLRLEDYTVEDVANTLKRYFRSLDDPLLTRHLYRKWLEKSGHGSIQTKLVWYKSILGEMPTLNITVLKRLILHLAGIADYSSENCMDIKNLASIFGPALMTLDTDQVSSSAHGISGYENTNKEIVILMDMIEYHQTVFEVDDADVKKELMLKNAMDKLADMMKRPSQSMLMEDAMIMPVHIERYDGECLTMQVPSDMTVGELIAKVTNKAGLQGACWVIHEIVCAGMLERPLHAEDIVRRVSDEWQNWDDELRKTARFCLKQSDFVQTLHSLFDVVHPLFGELRYAEKHANLNLNLKKSFKRFCFEFKQSKLTYYKDSKAAHKLGDWEIEKIHIYNGVEKRRGPPTEWGFTFIVKGEKQKHRNFGRCVCCASQDEALNWLSGMYKALYPNGFFN